MKSISRSRRAVVTRGVATAALIALAVTPSTATVICPQTSSPAAWSGSFLDTDTTKNGIVYDSGGARLQLQNGAGQFRSQSLGITDFTVYAAVGDFDHDGWDDFAGAGETDAFLRIYRNRTFDNPAPDWNDVNATRTPSFPVVRTLIASAATSVRRRPIAVGDFNGDGWADVFLAEHRLAETGTLKFMPNNAKLFLNQASNDTSGNPRFLASYSAMTNATSLTALGEMAWGGSTTQVLDINGDRKLDLLYSSSDNGGTIRVFLNNCTLASPQPTPVPAAPAPLKCSNNPTFTYSSVLITSMGLGSSGTARSPVFSYTDVDGDGLRDLIAAAPSCCTNAGDRLRLWKGQSGGGLGSITQSITFQGGGTAVFVHDFSGDGKPDLVVGTDNNNYNSGNGGELFYWVNTGTATPFSAASTKLSTHDSTSLIDYDVGFLFNYDHDPNNTMDVMIADGNHTGSFFIQANRVATSFVACGDAASGTINLGALASSEMVVTAARIHPTYTLNGGTIRFYLSNETPENWVQATPCPDATGDLCASFPRPVGRTVKWKVEMCSNATRTQTPVLSNVSATFDYTEAREHFRAGVIVNDGVAYLGGFRQPGDRGHLFAVNAGLTTTYWDAATWINSANDSARNVYTSNPSGTSRLDFTTANSDNLLSTLEVADATQAETVVDWVRSKRFGIGNDGIEKSRLGAIQSSTPAILTRPGFPIWYVYAGAADKLRHQAYQTAQRDRRNLVLFGSKDGMVHAIQTAPTAITGAPSGVEAWAFVPPRVASGMIGDYTNSLTSGATTIAAYPDGSPTLADYRKADGSFGTAALIGSGAGGKSLMALDVTATVSSSGSVVGPTPLWTTVPGEADAGQAFAKPAVARVLVGGAEKFVAIAATGIANENPTAPFTKGRVVAAYEVATGRLLWKFQAQCAVTSDIATFETDDDLEPNSPSFNGYADRVVFADACGYVYKLDPARDLGGDWNDNTGLGALAIDGATTSHPDGSTTTTAQFALFSTRRTARALGSDSPIAGTLAIRSDASTRVVLFFGTGGLESHPVTRQNEFYAIYADTGAVRSKMAGSCTASMCEKFYGGAVVTTQQVIFTRTTDPAVGTTTCDTGSTKVAAVSLEAGTGEDFTVDFTQSVASAVMGALYGDAGALYFATLGGDVSRIGTPRATAAGGDSAASSINPFGQGNESSTTGTVGTNAPLTLLGWRQIY
jgi:hypothetical protein